MNDRHNGHNDPLFFKPDEVDRQIDSLSQGSSSEQEDAEFIAYLRGLYATRSQQEQPTLNAIWDRIERGIPEVQRKKDRMVSIMPVQNRQETSSLLHRQPKNAFFTRLGNLVATILIIGIVGASVLVFTLVHRQSTTGGHNVSTTTATIFPSKQIGKVVYTSAAMSDGINTLSWSPDSNRVAIGTLQAESFDANTGKNVVMYGIKGNSAIVSVAWSPDGKQLAVTSFTQTIVSIYNAATGELQGQYKENALPAQNGTGIDMSGADLTVWSPDGKRMATAFRNDSSDAVISNPIQIWDTSSKIMLQNYTQHAGEVKSLAWSPDGKYILSASMDGSTQVWNASTGQRTLDIERHELGIGDAAWSPDGKILACSIRNGIELLDATSGKVLLTHHQSNNEEVSFVWSPDGHSIASGNNQIDLWDAMTGQTYYTFTDSGQYIHDFRWSPDGKYIASYTTESPDSKLQVWIAQ